jgi:UDP:flavonoid glycosyltransferase YjiC (YdhE family)
VRPRPLDGGGPAVRADAYIGFGTVPTFANARAELTAAVQACTSRRMRVVVTAPDEVLRRDLAALDEQLVDAREFVSLPELLSSCTVVISHAGAGTVLASLTAGVPLVLLPRGTPSQLRMAQACHRAGVGVLCSQAGFDAALDEVLGNPSIRTAAAAVARQISAMPAAADLVPLIEKLTRAPR